MEMEKLLKSLEALFNDKDLNFADMSHVNHFKKWISGHIAYRYENEGVIPTIEELHKFFADDLERGEDPKFIEEGLADFKRRLHHEKDTTKGEFCIESKRDY